MFDISFWELAMIGIIGLLVIGPERLPSVARTVGLWVGRARHMISMVKTDVERELKAEELKKTLGDSAAGLSELRDTFEEAKSSLDFTEEKDYLVKALDSEDEKSTDESRPESQPKSKPKSKPPTPSVDRPSSTSEPHDAD